MSEIDVCLFFHIRTIKRCKHDRVVERLLIRAFFISPTNTGIIVGNLLNLFS